MSYFDDNEDRIIYGGARGLGLHGAAVAPQCPYCNKPSRLVSGREIYPHRADLKGKSFYRCQPCDAFVGCHPGSLVALGTLANRELRSARAAAHRAFDPIWRESSKPRTGAYRWLAEQLGVPFADCHIGLFDIETCRRVVQLCTADDFEVLDEGSA